MSVGRIVLMICWIVLSLILPVFSQEKNDGVKGKEVEDLKERIRRLEEQVGQLLSELKEARERLAQVERASRGTGLQALNPEISVILDGTALSRGRTLLRRFSGFAFREAEIALTADIDPFGRAEGFFAVVPEEGIEVEEAYVSVTDPRLFRLPQRFQLKAGFFKAHLDRINLIHRPEQPMADLPLLHQRFFGDHGFSGAGLRLQYLFPSRRFWEGSLDILSTDNLSFHSPNGRPVILGRIRTSLDFTDDKSVKTWDIGFVSGLGPSPGNGQQMGDTTIYGLDLTHRWRPFRQGLYRSSAWHNQILFSHRKGVGSSKAFASLLEYQFSRTLYGAIRYDWAGSPDKSGIGSGLSLALSFFPSEFQRYRLQLNWHRINGNPVRELWLQGTWSIGVHRPHPF